MNASASRGSRGASVALVELVALVALVALVESAGPPAELAPPPAEPSQPQSSAPFPYGLPAGALGVLELEGVTVVGAGSGAAGLSVLYTLTSDTAPSEGVAMLPL